MAWTRAAKNRPQVRLDEAFRSKSDEEIARTESIDVDTVRRIIRGDTTAAPPWTVTWVQVHHRRRTEAR